MIIGKRNDNYNPSEIKNGIIMHKYAILVNTCDAYSDCWDPFFKLFTIYWPDYHGEIYLVTEKKDYSYGALNIKALKVCENDKKGPQTSWGIRFKRALKEIEENVILYMQDDYFLKKNVKNDILIQYARLMNKNHEIHCIHLTDQSVRGDSKQSKYHGLYPVILNQRYRASLQAAFWRKDVLLQYVRDQESIWDFEEFGSKRGEILKHNFYIVDKKKIILNKFEIIPYIFTGITGGRWKDEVVPLFERHDIKVDFSIRGMLNELPKRTLKMKIQGKLKRIPILFNHFLDIRKLKQGRKV